MHIDDVSNKAKVMFDGAPQQKFLAMQAVDGIRAGMQQLRALGHWFPSVEFDAPVHSEFPKMLYHDDYTDDPLVVDSVAELDHAKKLGWRETVTADMLAASSFPKTMSNAQYPNDPLSVANMEEYRKAVKLGWVDAPAAPADTAPAQ